MKDYIEIDGKQVQLPNLALGFVFQTKIRLMNDRFHIPAHQSAKLRR